MTTVLRKSLSQKRKAESGKRVQKTVFFGFPLSAFGFFNNKTKEAAFVDIVKWGNLFLRGYLLCGKVARLIEFCERFRRLL